MKKRINKNELANIVSSIIRIAIGCMFIYSSLPKIRHPYDFLSSVYSYELVGPKLGMFVAMTLPWLEVIVGICLVGGVFVSGALLVSLAMAAMFTFVLGSAMYHSLNITCGCFGASATETVGVSTLLRAAIIGLLSVVAYAGVIFVPRSNNLFTGGKTQTDSPIAIADK